MLIIGREIGQSVIIDDAIKVTVLQYGSKLRLAIDAPDKTRIIHLQGANKIEGLKKTDRRIGDTVQIEDSIKITVIQTETGQLRFAIDAPKEIGIFREEIYQNQMIETFHTIKFGNDPQRVYYKQTVKKKNSQKNF